jgi:hypothetical protein
MTVISVVEFLELDTRTRRFLGAKSSPEVTIHKEMKSSVPLHGNKF